MGLTYDGITYRSLEEQVRYDAEQVQLLKQADVTINENLQTVNTELNGKLTKPTNPSAESAVTMLADGTVGTKPLSKIGGKLYRHKIVLNNNSVAVIIINVYRLTPEHIPLYSLATYCNGILATCISDISEKYIGQVYSNDDVHINFNGTIIEPKTDPPSWKTIRVAGVELSVYEPTYEQLYTVIEM